MQSNIFFGIVENAALIIAIAGLYDFIWLKYDKKRKFILQVGLGILLSGIGILLMKNPWTFVDGIIFDTRSVLLTISGLFFGGVTTLVAILGTALYRIHIGGDGMIMGIAVIISSALIALAWRKFRPQIIEEKRLGEVYLVALVVHLAMLGCTIFLPAQNRIETLLAIFWPVLLIYPAATLLIALLLFQRQENWSNKKKLKESKNLFRFIAERANDLIYVYRLKPQPGFEYVSPSATRITGYTPEEYYADPQLGFKLVHPDDIHLLQGFFENKNFEKPVVLRWNKKDGSTIWTEQQNVPLYDEKGELVALHGIARDITSRKLSEQKLRKREQTLSNLIDNLPGFIYRCANDPNWTMLYLSPAVKKITGYEPDELINNQSVSFNEIILPQYRQSVWDNWQKALSKHEKILDEYEIKTKDGDTRWVWEQGKGIYDENGNLLYIEGYITDITEKKIAEQAIREKEHELAEIFNSTQEAILIYDFDKQTIIDCNNATEAIYGYTKNELIGKPFGYLSSFEPPYTIDEANKKVSNIAVKGSGTYTWQGKKKNGEKFWVEISLKLTTIRENKRFIAVVRDITERIAYQEQIAQREREFREIFNSTSEAIIIYDTKTNQIVDCNDRAPEMYGYTSKDEFLKCNMEDLGANVAPYTNDRIGINSRKAMVEGPQRFDWLAKRKNGEHFWVEVSLRRTRIGGVERDLTVVRDITERKKFENDLVKAKEKAEESDKLKSAFLANLSHEIRTPMNAIMGFTDLLKFPVDEAKHNEYIDIIQKSGKRLLDIISETVEIAKLDTGMVKPNPENFDLNQLMQDIYNEMKIKVSAKSELELILLNEKIDSPFNIYTDKVKLQQILVNLISNGIKYTPRGSVSFGYKVNNNRIIFTVKDTGIGIEQKYQDLIFKRFFRIQNPITIKVGGIGLGLAISKAYIELLGGTIELNSAFGRGTEVTISLPYQKVETQPESNEEIPLEQLKGENQLLLVAEDDDFNFLFINEILTSSNYQCIRASNGQEAVDLARKNDNVKLILMDLKMPVMDGYRAFDEIKAFKPNLPIVAQTAYALGEDKEKINNHGFDGCIHKPIKKNELLKIIREKLYKPN
jgi:PAS domain S-box-containing protein